MSIENIQKKRLIDILFKIYHAIGDKPSYNDIDVLFGQYFSVNKPGNPVIVPYGDLNAFSKIDYNTLNKIMATLMFNIDVIYDSYSEDVEALYAIISAYKFRLENLRNTRAEVETKVDDYLFSLNNTDGFYYSVTNAFNNLESTDIDNTTAVVDTETRKVTLPKITSGLFDYVGNILSRATAVEVAVFFDGERVDLRQGVDFSNVFNGLNNSNWNYVGQDQTVGYKSSTIGNCTLRISVPIDSIGNVGVSNIEGRLISRKQVDTSVIVNDKENADNSLFFSKKGSLDYDVFSFNFEPKVTSKIDIFFSKIEPDQVLTDNSQNKLYVYDFTIDELVISAPYYDSSATYISKPVQVVDGKNKNMMVDAVMLEAQEQIPAGCSVRYYIAQDNASESDVNQLNWTEIAPSSRSSSNSENIIRFNGATMKAMEIVDKINNSIIPTSTNFIRIPRTADYSNPIQNYYYQSDYSNYGFNLYRLAKFPSGIEPISPYILENVKSKQIKVQHVTGTTLSFSAWQEITSGYRKDVVVTTSESDIGSTDVFFTGNSIPAGSVYLSTNVYAQTDATYTNRFLKTSEAQYWNVDIYLNGRLLTTVESGAMFASITWNFRRGQNSIDIVINNSTTGTSASSFQGSISLMEGMSLSQEVGLMPFQNYLFQVKIEDLRTMHSNQDNVFSVITWENNKEIVYRREKEISSGSIVYYLQNLDNGVLGLRVRIDLSRGQTAYSSPAINSYKLKLRH